MTRRTPKNAQPSVYQITGARKSLSEDVEGRQRRYLISMGIRTVCFVLAVVLRHDGPLWIVMIIASLVLPYFAVVIANAGRERAYRPPVAMIDPRGRELEAGKDSHESPTG